MSQRHSDGRALAPSASLPINGRDPETVYSNCVDGRWGQPAQGGHPGVEFRGGGRQQSFEAPVVGGGSGGSGGGGRQRAMSDATKAKGSKKPMPAPKPLSLSTGRGDGPSRNRKKSTDVCTQEAPEECLYDEAFTVGKGKPPRNDPPTPSGQQEGIYGEALPVAGHRLPAVERNAARKNVDPEPIYDEATAVCISKIPVQKQPSAKKKSSGAEEENLYEDAALVSKSKLENLYEDAALVSQSKLENLYEDAATVSQTKLQNLYEDAATVSRSKLPPTELNKYGKVTPEPIYCDAAPVMSTRLPKDEKHVAQKMPEVNCGADDSDDEEPQYFNLLLLQKSIGNQKLWNCRADPHMGRVKVEQNARRLSAIKVLPTLPPKKFGQLGSVAEDSSNREGASGSLSRHQTFDDEWSDDLIGLQSCDETEMKKMRRWIIGDILKSEKNYCEMLERLCYFMKTLKDNVGSSHEIISSKDIETIFVGIQELCNIHSEFVKSIQSVIEKSSKDCHIGKPLKEMIVKEYDIADKYLKKHHEAISTFQRCCGESQQFAELAKTMKYCQMETNLEELLRKPIERFQCNALVLHDLKNCTPTSHKDFNLIGNSLKIAKNFLDICSGSSDSSIEDSRYLVKNGIVVEKPDKDRKLRHVFLFNDLLVCCKQKIQTNKNRLLYEVKWYIPLCDLKLEDKFSAQEEKQADIRHQEEIGDLKKELVKLQKELKDEMRKLKTADGQVLTHKQNKPLENIRRKLAEQEAKLLVASPHLQLKLLNQANQKTFILLMASDYERTNWKSTISGLLDKGNQTPAKLSLPDVISLINMQRIPKLLGSALDNTDISFEEERLNGSLNVIIHKLQGLKEDADAFCCVEMDSFGHFFTKAKTNRKKGREPVWNEDFDIDLEGAQSMHILCYKIGQHTDSLLGKCSLALHKEWITEDFDNKGISLGSELLLTVSLKYTSPEKLKRSSSSVKSDIFGVKLERIVKKEGRPVPLIVTACTEEIERRGLKDVGIYRISGLSSEIQRLKKAFNKNSSDAVAGLQSVDTNVLTSLLKLFFRELSEALFTDSGYPEFVKGIGLSDPDTKERFLVSQLVSLPYSNYSIILYLLNHLFKVSQYEESNKMSLMNLATVFGPTLLRPAEKDQKTAGTESLFCSGASEVVLQSTILLYFLNLRAKNYNFPPPKPGK